MDYKTIVVRKEDLIALVTLNRPEAANTINFDMKNELMRLLSELSHDDETRVLVITGAGNMFSAGGDFRPRHVREKTVSVKEAEDMQPEYDDVKKGNVLPAVIELTLALQRFGKPTIAMVNGPAIGQGFDVALACDLRTGSQQARFMMGFVNMGLPPVTGGAWLLPRVIGTGLAMEYIYTGDWCTAEEAYRIGLLNRLAAPEKLEEETMKLAGRIAQGAPIAHRLAKEEVRRGQDMDLESSLAFSTTCAVIAGATDDHQEGIKALAEKRRPQFKGR